MEVPVALELKPQVLTPRSLLIHCLGVLVFVLVDTQLVLDPKRQQVQAPVRTSVVHTCVSLGLAGQLDRQPESASSRSKGEGQGRREGGREGCCFKN